MTSLNTHVGPRTRRELPAVMNAITIAAMLARRDPARPGAMGKYRDVTVQLAAQAVPRPQDLEVLVRIHAVAVCGSDIHAGQSDAEGWSKSSVPAAGWERPGGLTLGHEYSGCVVAIGDDVNPAWLGQMVTGDSLIPCYRCVVCRQGSPNECPQGRLIGLESPGVFANYAVVPATTLHPLHGLWSEMGDEAMVYGCLAEPLGVAAKALDEAMRNLPAGADLSLLIRGAGPLGICVGAVGRVLGFEPVVLIEPIAARRQIAIDAGHMAFDIGELREQDYIELFGAGAAVVVDACGSSDLLTGLRPAGVIACLARTGRELCLPQDDLMTRGIKLVPSRGHVGYLPRVLDWLAHGLIDPRPLVTHKLYGLEELLSWLRHSERFNDACKVICHISKVSGVLP